MDLTQSGASGFVRVLVVEDDGMQATILKHALVAKGFNVDIASDGLAAVRMVETVNYSAVLVDYNIPEIDGLATARLLGDMLGPIARPVLIALTATPENLAVRDSGAESAFDLVLDKSCSLATLISSIWHCLGAAPNAAKKQAAKDAIYDRDEDDFFNGPERTGIAGDVPAPPRILVVEDDPDQQMLLRNMLESKGYVVETTADGLAAIRQICGNAWDLAIVDYNLPGIDGMAVGTLILDQMAEAWRPRLIALTATPGVLHDRISKTGPMFDKIVDKLSGLDELMDSVDYLLRVSPNPDTRRAVAQLLPDCLGAAPVHA